MGYRKLLKDYMQHVEAIVGVDLVELAALTNALNKRDLGELRTMSAELSRESFMERLPTDQNHIVHDMLQHGTLQLSDLPLLNGINAAPQGNEVSLSDEQFQQFVHLLLNEAKRIEAEDSDAKNGQRR
ncbi:MAG: hypothetical protein AAF993_01585 [Pseudomonadota bacterium]